MSQFNPLIIGVDELKRQGYEVLISNHGHYVYDVTKDGVKIESGSLFEDAIEVRVKDSNGMRFEDGNLSIFIDDLTPAARKTVEQVYPNAEWKHPIFQFEGDVPFLNDELLPENDTYEEEDEEDDEEYDEEE